VVTVPAAERDRPGKSNFPEENNSGALV